VQTATTIAATTTDDHVARLSEPSSQNRTARALGRVRREDQKARRRRQDVADRHAREQQPRRRHLTADAREHEHEPHRDERPEEGRGRQRSRADPHAETEQDRRGRPRRGARRDIEDVRIGEHVSDHRLQHHPGHGQARPHDGAQQHPRQAYDLDDRILRRRRRHLPRPPDRVMADDLRNRPCVDRHRPQSDRDRQRHDEQRRQAGAAAPELT
jgi:hypothetical protein